jgi:hypothetical protein
MDSDEQPGTRLRENLRRMFKERGLDFFDQDDEQRQANKPIDDLSRNASVQRIP